MHVCLLGGFYEVSRKRRAAGPGVEPAFGARDQQLAAGRHVSAALSFCERRHAVRGPPVGDDGCSANAFRVQGRGRNDAFGREVPRRCLRPAPRYWRSNLRTTGLVAVEKYETLFHAVVVVSAIGFKHTGHFGHPCLVFSGSGAVHRVSYSSVLLGLMALLCIQQT